VNDRDQEVMQKLHKHFSNKFQGEMFELSMGTSSPPRASMICLCDFLAHAVAVMAYFDLHYAQRFPSIHSKLKDMCSNIEKIGINESTAVSAYYSALFAGSMIETALGALREVLKDEPL
jgi:hypothetical protein